MRPRSDRQTSLWFLEVAVEPRAAVIADLLRNIVVASGALKLQHVVGFLGVLGAVRGIGRIQLRPQLRQSGTARGIFSGEKRDVGRALSHMTLEDDGAPNIVVIEPHHRVPRPYLPRHTAEQ